MTRRCILDGEAQASLPAIYDALAQQLGFPQHFGRNLDALWDVLTTDLPGPVEIEWRNSGTARQRLGRDYERIAKLFDEVAAARRDFRVTKT